MAEEESLEWLVQLHEEQAPTLHRLAVLLGAESESGRIVRSAMLALYRRGHRLIDPVERVQFLQEHVVHLARAVRPATASLSLPSVEEPRQEEILTALSALPTRVSEIIVVSHYLSVFGPDLAGIVRMSVRGCNQRLEIALETLRAKVGDPTPGSQPGVIESLSQEVTAALRSSARQVQPPGTETLEAELLELAQERTSTIGPRLVGVLLLLAIALGVTLAALTRPTVSATEPTVSPSELPSVGVTESIPAMVRGVPLYYVGRQDGMLYREARDLPASGNLLRSAMEAILSLAPLDPDYTSDWGAGQLLSATVVDDTLTLDLTPEVYQEMTTARSRTSARDQVVYTASELLGIPELKVFFLSDGITPPTDFQTSTGFTRRGLEPMPQLWITAPRNAGQQAPGSVVILGTVKPDATVPIVTVTNIDTGDVVTQASAQTATDANSDGWRVWTVTVNLAPGSYDVRAAVSSGEPATQSSENKAIKVG